MLVRKNQLIHLFLFNSSLFLLHCNLHFRFSLRRTLSSVQQLLHSPLQLLNRILFGDIEG